MLTTFVDRRALCLCTPLLLQVWDNERVVIIPDHYIFTADPRANRNVDILRYVVVFKAVLALVPLGLRGLQPHMERVPGSVARCCFACSTT